MRLNVDALLTDRRKRIILCCGSGGVGKTTVGAALALRAAEMGRKAVVLTIDPARRLAQSLGLTELDNTPRAVPGVDTTAGGCLDAMMLDMKRTFDEVIVAHASPQKAAAVLANPFYEALSTSFSGTQEYMAMEKLGQLDEQARETGRWDLIVVDTPPSRSALDFLAAPEHLSNLLDGKILRFLLAPARGPFKFMSAGVSLMTSAMSKVLGGQLLGDVQTFVTAFETLFGGFRMRADRTLATLASPHTTFLVVTTAEPDPIGEARFFVNTLGELKLPLSGIIVNRVHSSAVELSAERSQALAEDLDSAVEDMSGAASDYAVEVVALRRHAARMQVIAREQDLLRRLRRTHPTLATAQLAALNHDVTNLPTLREVGRLLGTPSR